MTAPRYPTEEDHRRVKYLMDHDECLEELVGVYMWAFAKMRLYTGGKYGKDLSDVICSCAAVQSSFIKEEILVARPWEEEQ